MQNGINDSKKAREIDFSTKIRILQRTTLLQLCMIVLAMIVHRSASAPITDSDGHISVTTDDLSKDSFIVDLPYSFRIFGDGKFNSVYINPVGAVSFAGGISTSKLDSIKNKVIVFSPLLLLPDIKANVTVQFKFTDVEKEALQQRFRDVIDEQPFFELLNALKITWNEDSEGDGTGNVYEIAFANDDKDRTFVMYDYIQVDRIEDEHGYARAGIFALEDGSVLCPHELEGSGTENVFDVEDFNARIDLPLLCRSFDYSCKADNPTTEEVEEKLVAKFQDFFFETRSKTEWMFYRLYFCQPRLTKHDNTVSIKEACGYDPDYYEYSWRPTTDSDICTVLETTEPLSP